MRNALKKRNLKTMLKLISTSLKINYLASTIMRVVELDKLTMQDMTLI